MAGDDVADRLRRMRRATQRAAPDASPATAHSERADAVRRTLAQRDGRRLRNEPVASAASAGPTPSASAAPAHSVTPRLGLPSELERESGQPLVRRATFPRAHRHGALELADAARADPRVFALLTGHRDLAGIDLARALYLDTETSGLAGGAGTYVFMVGLGSFTADGFEVWQGFLDDPAHETSLLEEAAARVREAPAIVSFFGKSFDRHRLEDRMRCLGIEPPFAGRPHLDLYHPLRRLYRGAFADHRLRTLESALCGLERADDLPGSFAPAAWFDFLAGRPHRLEGVFRHNRDDVLSLVTLAAHLGGVLGAGAASAAGTPDPADARAANLARALAQAGDAGGAVRVCDETLSRGTLGERRARDLRVLRALLAAETCPAPDVACALRDLAREAEDEHTASVLVRLARLEKSALGDPDAARATCARAAEVAARRHTGRDRARLERALAQLCAGIERKLARAARRPAPPRGE